MALQVWLPLTKDLRNQGLANITSLSLVSGNSLTSGGKVGGQCLALTKLQTILENSSCMSNKKQISYAYWIKVNTAWSANWLDGIRWTSSNGTTNSITRQEFYTNCTRVGTWFPSSSTNSISGKDFTPEVWTHLAATLDYSTGDVNFYINGVLQGHVTTLDTTYYCRGDFYIGDNGVDVSMNDVRIYDHCLSPMEVKELAKGLVLHYPLNRQGWGQENLLKGTRLLDGDTSVSSGVTKTINAYQGFTSATYNNSSSSSTHELIYWNKKIVVNANEVYTVSFYAKSPSSAEMYCYFYNNNAGIVQVVASPTSSSSTGAQVGSGDGSTRIKLSTNWKRYWVKWVFSNSSSAQKSLLFRCVARTGELSVCGVKLEKGSIPTPWCPNSSDILATTMGLNGTTEYDISGFCNNGTKNNITYTSDTPKYTVSSIFNGSNSYIKVNDNNWMVKGMSEMTVNLWAKATTWPTNGGKLVSCTESGGFNLEAGNSGYWRFPIYVYTNSGQTSSAYKYDSNEIKIADLIPNEWNMITLVYETTGTKTYINGELHHTYTNTSYGINFNTNARLFLGCEASTANPTSPYFNGKECDFRIYATALSADDVKSLYQNCATIDADGTIHGQIRS